MKIVCFNTCNGMDPRAINHGVYMIELLEKEESVCLYIGETVWIASRCGVHLYSLYENPNYFGLTKEDIDNDEFTLKFSVIDSLNEKKSVLGVGQYKSLELDAIRRNKPLTQLETSDRQIRDVQEKIKTDSCDCRYPHRLLFDDDPYTGQTKAEYCRSEK